MCAGAWNLISPTGGIRKWYCTILYCKIDMYCRHWPSLSRQLNLLVVIIILIIISYAGPLTAWWQAGLWPAEDISSRFPANEITSSFGPQSVRMQGGGGVQNACPNVRTVRPKSSFVIGLTSVVRSHWVLVGLHPVWYMCHYSSGYMQVGRFLSSLGFLTLKTSDSYTTRPWTLSLDTGLSILCGLHWERVSSVYRKSLCDVAIVFRAAPTLAQVPGFGSTTGPQPAENSLKTRVNAAQHRQFLAGIRTRGNGSMHSWLENDTASVCVWGGGQ